MSFKREGDDQNQLNVLKKRRVADLLSNFIPEDEATLLKNGRYSCLVCSYRPVFDTVDMLTIHRKGKRHLESLKWFYGKKTDLQKEIGKRQHQEYVNKEACKQEQVSSAPLLTQTRKITHHALLRSAPYSSCHKKASERTEDLMTLKKNSTVNHQNVGQIIIPTAKTKTDTSDTSPADATAAHASQCYNKNQIKNKRCRSKAANTSESESLTEQRRRELEHYLKLKSAGWLQDPGGNWVKDQNVEFDSDEEEPLPLLHTETM